MIWICPTRTKWETLERCLACEADSVGTVTVFRDYDPAPFAHENGGRASPRAVGTKHGSRGRDPSKRFGLFRLQSAFSLVEVLASLFILTLSAVGITAAWRLADYQELLTRADRRAERILRQYYELQTFAPADSRPFTSASPSPSPITGYLYYPKLIAGQSGSPQFGKMIPFSISMTNGTAGAQLVLTYTIPTYGTQASRQVTKTVALNP